MTAFTVIGGHGRIGRAVVRRLEQQGQAVWVPMRDDPALFERQLGRVVYAAGLTADFRTRPLDTVQAHVCLLREVLARSQFESLVYLSSTRVYGGALQGREDVPITVNPWSASDLYNLSKLMGESLCLHGGRPGVRVARVSNVVGAEEADSPDFLPSIIRQARQGDVHLLSALETEKDYVMLEDVVTMLLALSLGGQHAIYNVAGGRQISHAQWVKRLTEIHGRTTRVEPGAPTLSFPPIDMSRMHSEFGIQPRSALEHADLL